MPENEKYQGDEKLLILPLGEESKKITQVISNDTARQIIELLADAPLSANDIAQRLQAPLTTITYNLENLESVGLIKVEKIKYSEKGREVKIYAPVRKLIVVVPEKTDKRSVADMLRKYIGVIMAAVLASSFIEFLSKSVSMSTKLMQTNEYSLNEAPVPSPEITQMPFTAPVHMINETIRGADAGNIIPTPVATALAKSAPVITPEPAAVLTAESVPAATSPIVPAPIYDGNASATAAPVHIAPSGLDNGTVGQAVPDIVTNLVNTITAHPGLLFLMGCLFVIALFIIIDYRRKRKNG